MLVEDIIALAKEHGAVVIRADRLRLARQLCDRARIRFRATAVAIFGSVARGDDGPFF